MGICSAHIRMQPLSPFFCPLGGSFFWGRTSNSLTSLFSKSIHLNWWQCSGEHNAAVIDYLTAFVATQSCWFKWRRMWRVQGSAKSHTERHRVIQGHWNYVVPLKILLSFFFPWLSPFFVLAHFSSSDCSSLLYSLSPHFLNGLPLNLAALNCQQSPERWVDYKKYVFKNREKWKSTYFSGVVL